MIIPCQNRSSMRDSKVPAMMATYKILKSIAHDIGHSFCSALNYYGNDYVLGHLLGIARSTGLSTFSVDLLTRSAEPKEFLIPPVAESVTAYREWFRSQVATRISPKNVVRAARTTIRFDLQTTRSYEHDSRYVESPFECILEILDDRGKKYEAKVSGWWSPECRALATQN